MHASLGMPALPCISFKAYLQALSPTTALSLLAPPDPFGKPGGSGHWVSLWPGFGCRGHQGTLHTEPSLSLAFLLGQHFPHTHIQGPCPSPPSSGLHRFFTLISSLAMFFPPGCLLQSSADHIWPFAIHASLPLAVPPLPLFLHLDIPYLSFGAWWQDQLQNCLPSVPNPG